MMHGAVIMVCFLINPDAEQKKVIVDWDYNAWGNKYPPYDLDDVIPTLVGRNITSRISSRHCNGRRLLLNLMAQRLINCLPNRNPQLNQEQIEYLSHYYGIDQYCG